MTPDQGEQLVRLIIAFAIFAVAVGGLLTIYQLDGHC